jgi:hypothetical protein
MEKYDSHKLFMSFGDAVTLGLGIAVGTFMAYLAIALVGFGAWGIVTLLSR